jgi:predicted permease
VANLLLSRAVARQQEIAVRAALGASRGRIIRQLLTESVLLAFIGAALGIVIAYWGRQLLPDNLAIATPLDWRVMGFVGGLALATGVVFGIAPAWRSSGTSVGAAVKDARGSVGGRRSVLGKSLVVVQVAISLVLLVGAGLFLRTVDKLRHVDVGFDAQSLLLVSVNPALNHYDQPQIANLFGALLERLPQIPGARSATLSVPALLSGRMFSGTMVIQGRPSGRNGLGRISSMTVAPNFFDTLGIPVIAGRGFTARDDRRMPHVIVINEAAARKFFPYESPLGQRIGSRTPGEQGSEIIGVVRDVKYNSVRDEAPPTGYSSYLQSTRLDLTTTFELRTAADPAAVATAAREAIREIDPNLPIILVSTQTDQIERRFAQEKVFAQAYALFGGLAVLIASIGLFGLMSYAVARRTNEIGIRMALGARGEDLVSMIMREALLLVAGGVVIGTAVALGAGRFVATLLFDLAPNDPLTIAGAAAIMIAISALAGYLPARAAARVDPMVALRDE